MGNRDDWSGGYLIDVTCNNGGLGGDFNTPGYTSYTGGRDTKLNHHDQTSLNLLATDKLLISLINQLIIYSPKT